ncbi:MAG: AAA family ATPase [Arcobacteraceae bacterium]|jgi:ATP-dependent exoDNAse (exonuclease V) alpha subunit|nr:AAA family ATPase [Arcobacteraceae bacterium]
MRQIRQQTNSNLTADQYKVFDKVLSNIIFTTSNCLKHTDIKMQISSIVGSAGTGKTFLTIELVRSILENNLSVAITAPTNKAVGVISQYLSKNSIQATTKTIHSFLCIKEFKDYSTGAITFKVDQKAKKTKVDVLIVDESSMVSQELFELICDAIQSGLVGYVVFVGDSNQLLPINDVISEVFTLKNNYKLTQIIRQAKDSYIIDIANKLKDCIESKQFMPLDEFFKNNHYKELKMFHNEQAFLRDFYSEANWLKKNKIITSYKNIDVNGFNKQVRDEQWRQKGIASNEFLRQGDRIRFVNPYTVNDINIYYNGQEIELEYTIQKYQEELEIYYWECKNVNHDEQQIFRVVDPISENTFNDKLKYLAKKAKSLKDYRQKADMWKLYFQLKESYANIQYVFSSTIHKLQGSTYDECYINAYDLVTNNMLSDEERYRLLYVAVTRASKDIKIFLPALKNDNDIDIEKIHQEIDQKLKMIF